MPSIVLLRDCSFALLAFSVGDRRGVRGRGIYGAAGDVVRPGNQ